MLLVLGQHLALRANLNNVAWMPTTSWGLFGVLLFFVHTCLVLMYSMERGDRTGFALVKNFAIRRMFRIYPLSLLAVLAAVALHLDSDVNGVHGLSHAAFVGYSRIASNLLLIQNLTFAKSIVNVLWSLPFELQMYVFLPFLFMWIQLGTTREAVRAANEASARETAHSRDLQMRRDGSKSGTRFSLWLFLVWIGAVGAALIQPNLPWLERLSILVFLPNFLPGVLAYTLPYRPRIPSALWPAFLLLLIVLFSLRPEISTGWLLCLVLGTMIPRFREIQTPWLRSASHHIATYSYGIYLSHPFAIWIATGVLAAHSLAFRVIALATLLVGLPVMLFHAIEKPMIQLGVRLAARATQGESKHRPRVAQANVISQTPVPSADTTAGDELNLTEEPAP